MRGGGAGPRRLRLLCSLRPLGSLRATLHARRGLLDVRALGALGARDLLCGHLAAWRPGGVEPRGARGPEITPRRLRPEVEPELIVRIARAVLVWRHALRKGGGPRRLWPRVSQSRALTRRRRDGRDAPAHEMRDVLRAWLPEVLLRRRQHRSLWLVFRQNACAEVSCYRSCCQRGGGAGRAAIRVGPADRPKYHHAVRDHHVV